ncbi:hypothetical protein IIC38_11345 [candidate division KSB1 bacterium]|nr:hypothetical protein [candidate division KSB1 bacterium]
MRKIITPQLFLLLLLSVSISCSSSDNPFSLSDVERSEFISVLKVELVGAENETTVDKAVPEIGTSDQLLVGKYRGVESGIVVKFESISDNISGTIKEALLIFNQIGNITGDSTNSISVEAHEVTTSWTTENVDPAAILLSSGTELLGSVTFAIDSTGLDTIRISEELVQRWLDQPGSNNGVLVLAPNAEDIFVYSSDEKSLGPILALTYIENDSTKNVTLSDSDASSVFTFEAIPADRHSISTGLESELFISFSFPDIPDNATINFANIVMKVDTANSIFPSTETFFSLTRIIAILSDGQFTGEVDSTVIGLTNYNNGPQLTVEITALLQLAINEKKEDFGFRIATLDPTRSIFRTLLYTSEADSTNKPRAEIFYTLPPVSQSN